MQDLKISLITVCSNAEGTIRECIESVLAQSFRNVEYIIVDGASKDKTIETILLYKPYISVFVTEPDNGIYDAMNKALKLATGDVIGMLNADDCFANPQVLEVIAEEFIRRNADIVYGDLDYVDEVGNIIRKWRSGGYAHGMFNWGWMPPHPTFYCSKSLFKQFGNYSLNYGTAADYELMARFMHKNKTKANYIRQVFVRMKTGGVSNKNLINRLRSIVFDFKAMRDNNITAPLLTVLLKPLRKINQFL